jgi:hypothetical protein
MNFDNITLLPVEKKLLLKMVDGWPVNGDVSGIGRLQKYGLLDINPTNTQSDKMQYILNDYGRNYVRYLNSKNRDKCISNIKFWVTLAITVATLIVTILTLIKH